MADEPEVPLALIPDDDENDEETEETTEEEPWTPPTREEYENLQRLAKKNADQAVKYRQRLKAAETAPKESNTDDIEKVKAEAAKAVEDKYKSRVVFAEAKAELSAMGLQGDPGKLLKLIDLDEIDVDDDEIVGLSTQLASLKDDFPQLFEPAKKTPKADPRTKRDAAPKDEPKTTPNTLDALAQAMLGR